MRIFQTYCSILVKVLGQLEFDKVLKGIDGWIKVQKMTHELSSDIFINKYKQPPSLYVQLECSITKARYVSAKEVIYPPSTVGSD